MASSCLPRRLQTGQLVSSLFLRVVVRENARIIEIAYEKKEKKRNSGSIIVSVQKKVDA